MGLQKVYRGFAAKGLQESNRGLLKSKLACLPLKCGSNEFVYSCLTCLIAI